MNLAGMQAQLVLHEGIKLAPYLDTEENWTVLVGYNLTSRGWDFVQLTLGRRLDLTPTDVCPFGSPLLTRGDALQVLAADITRVERAVIAHFPEYLKLCEARQRVVIDMAFAMGFRVEGFVNCKAALIRGDNSTASRELYKSKWGVQVGEAKGQRCDRLAKMLLTGRLPDDVPPLKEAPRG